jgi:hypothetical protein
MAAGHVSPTVLRKGPLGFCSLSPANDIGGPQFAWVGYELTVFLDMVCPFFY